MSKKLNSELAFLCILFVFSFLAYYPNPIKEPLIFDSIQNHNISDTHPDILDKDGKLGLMDFTLKNGFLYSGSDYGYVSSFYQDNISLISSSDYWKFPVFNKESIFFFQSNSDEKLELNISLNREITLPLVSLLFDPMDLFGYENGIYINGNYRDFNSSNKFYSESWNKPANYYIRGETSERNVYFSYYNQTGNYQYSTYCKLRINGNATRSFPQKSLRLTCQRDLGEKEFGFNFFNTKNRFSSLILRNGGNDNTKALFRDMLMQELVQESNLDVSSFRPCIVYLNGSYWGIYFLQNRFDRNFVAEKYGVKEKKVSIVENWNLAKGSEIEWRNLRKQVDNFINKKTNYDQIEGCIDLDNFSTYLAAEIFFANTDWPNNNLKMFKISDTKKDNTKWRFVFFDLDYGFGYVGENAFSIDMFDYLFHRKDSFSLLFQRLMTYPQFRNLLKNKLVLFLGKHLSKRNIMNHINRIEHKIEKEIENHCERWLKPRSLDEWLREVEILRKFGEKRAIYIEEQIKKYLN